MYIESLAEAVEGPGLVFRADIGSYWPLPVDLGRKAPGCKLRRACEERPRES